MREAPGTVLLPAIRPFCPVNLPGHAVTLSVA